MNVSPINAAELTAVELASTGVFVASDDTDAQAKVKISDISIVKSSDKASTALPMR